MENVVGEGAGCASEVSDDDDVVELTMPAPREGAVGGDEAGGRPGTSPDTPVSLYELDWGAQYLNCP